MTDLVLIDEVLTPEEFQQHPRGLNGKKSLWSVRDMLRRNRIPHFKVGREYFVRLSTWEAFIREQEEQAKK
jgi:hypothetical protein